MFLLCQYKEMLLHFKRHMETFLLFQMGLLPNNNFLISKQTRHQKLIQKCWRSRLVLLFFEMPCFLYKQTELSINTLNRQINTSTGMNCIYSLVCFCSDVSNILHKFSWLVCIWFQYLLYKFRRYNKLHLKCHPIKNWLTFAILTFN